MITAEVGELVLGFWTVHIESHFSELHHHELILFLGIDQ